MHSLHLNFIFILLFSIKHASLNESAYDNAQCSIENDSICQGPDPMEKYKKGKYE